MSPQELESNLRKFLACAVARYKLSKTCFRGIPDPGNHAIEAENYLKGAKKCREQLKKCRQPQTQPDFSSAPAPIITSPPWWENFPW
jgi:hypothetical protein